MKIEYACLDLRKMLRQRDFSMLEEKLNSLVPKGWRVKCFAGGALILSRQVEVK